MPKAQNRVAKTAYLDPAKVRRLDAKLITRGQTFTDWVRQCLDRELEPSQ